MFGVPKFIVVLADSDVPDAIERVEKLLLAFIELRCGKEVNPCSWTAIPERRIDDRRRSSGLIKSCRWSAASVFDAVRRSSPAPISLLAS